ncbi:PHD finger protein 7 [Drosophila virilis]|uniref:PHD finger protein 7 n=1 Tax=Drosophila virilis TaxID=7244 RepID=UPI001395D47F|nr:PHD finger protein 7 [Drosophila virilis]
MGKCTLCRSSTDDELRLGKFHSRGKIDVHENCLYLSSNLVQRGNGSNDILNFTVKDIQAESERTKCLFCCYCHKAGANIGCCKPGCRKAFHTPCGLNNGSQNQYVGTYKSFCNIHIESYTERPKARERCVICFELLVKPGNTFSCTKYMHGKCCNNGWYHKDCLQHYANSAGYFFKCPLCNDTERFRSVAYWGITVPDRDASWEENDAFADQLVVPTQCTAQNCIRAGGREGSTLTMFYCVLCGSNPMHTECTNLNNETYRCNDCSVVPYNPSMYETDESDVDVKDDDEDDDNDDDDLDPLEIFASMGTAAVGGTTTCQLNRALPQSSNIKYTIADSDSESDFDWNNFPSRSSRCTNEKENVTRANAIIPTTTRPNTNRTLRNTAPLRTRNRQTLPSDDGHHNGAQRTRSSLYAESRHNKDAEPLGCRTRSRSRQNIARLSADEVELGDKFNGEPIAQRTRNSPCAIQRDTPTLISCRRSRRRSIAGQNLNRGLHSPFDISCVANRTRARSRK